MRRCSNESQTAERSTGVGIACAGPVDTVAGVVAPINITEWAQGFELVAGVRSVFPDAGTALAMDGAAAALAGVPPRRRTRNPEPPEPGRLDGNRRRNRSRRVRLLGVARGTPVTSATSSFQDLPNRAAAGASAASRRWQVDRPRCDGLVARAGRGTPAVN